MGEREQTAPATTASEDEYKTATEEQLVEALGHCFPTTYEVFPSWLVQIEKARKLDYTEDESLLPKTDEGEIIRPYEYAEHLYLGNALSLQWYDGKTYLGKDLHLAINENLTMTYGHLNALGGDFYGSDEPICEGNSVNEKKQRFLQAYHYLADPSAAQQVKDVLAWKQKEVDVLVQTVKERSDDPSEVYHSDKMDGLLTDAFKGSWNTMSGKGKSYLTLASTNYDHFGENARIAYNTGHSVALDVAKGGTPKDLEKAYTLNAFADHFLEDSFAAGHIRTPRKAFGSGIFAGLCCHTMHDEDNELGLAVRNLAGETWTAYGDKRLLDNENGENLRRLHNALTESADEIYSAWKTQTVPDETASNVWKHAPVLQSAFEAGNHSPLFNEKLLVRKNWDNRFSKEYETFFSWATLSAQLQVAKAFKHPMHK